MNIIDEITKSGYTISFVAQKLGINRQTLYNWSDKGDQLSNSKKERVLNLIYPDRILNDQTNNAESKKIIELEKRVSNLERLIVKHLGA